MLAYFFDGNGWYQDSHEIMEDPLHPGSYLLPPNGTLIAPPNPGPNQRPKFVSGTWELDTDPDYLASQAAAVNAAEAAKNARLVLYYRIEEGKDSVILGSDRFFHSKTGNGDDVLYKGFPLPSYVGAAIFSQDPTDWNSVNIDGVPTRKIVNGIVVSRDQADMDAENPRLIHDQMMAAQSRFVIFFRNLVGKDTAILGGQTWGSTGAAWNEQEPYYNGLPISDPSNSQVGFAVFNTEPENWNSKNENNIVTKRFVGGVVVDRTSEDIFSDDEIAQSKQIVVFYRNEAGKDTKVLKAAEHGSVWDKEASDYKWLLGHVSDAGSKVSAEIIDCTVGDATATNNHGVALKKVSNHQLVDRFQADIDVDIDNKSWLTSNCQQQIDTLLAPKQNITHLMEIDYDQWLVMKAFMTHLGLQGSDLGAIIPGSSSAYQRLLDREATLYPEIQGLRASRDAAIALLEQE